MTKSLAELTDVPFLSISISNQVNKSVQQTIRSGMLGPGKETQRFESKLKELFSTEDCVLTSSGTIALGLAAKSLAIPIGSEIAVPAYGVISVANGFTSMGYKVRPIDICKRSAVIDVSKLDESIRKLGPVSGICLVAFSGYRADDSIALVNWAKDKKIPIIEDLACGLGVIAESKDPLMLGDICTTSFSVAKTITTGQGGAVLGRTKNVQVARAWIDQGDLEWRKTGVCRELGTNLRFTDIQSSLGLGQLEEIDSILEKRERIFNILTQEAGEFLWQLPNNSVPLYHIVFSNNPTKFVEEARKQGIECKIQYTTLTNHPSYKQLKQSVYPISDWWSGKAVYLPIGGGLTIDNAKRVSRMVSDLVGLLIPSPHVNGID